MTEAATLPGALRFTGEWRRYQELALEAFERDRAAGRRRRTSSPRPARARRCSGSRSCAGSARPRWCSRRTRRSRRSGRRRRRRSARPPGSSPTAGRAGAVPHLPGARAARRPRRRAARRRRGALGRRARARHGAGARRPWRPRRRRGRARREAAQRRSSRASPPRSSARSRAAARRAATSRELLAPGARERVEALRAAGVGTIVLDECHHLASLWGYVVRAVLEELGGDVHVVGLTATPPDELTTEEAELYAALLGPVDFQVPTPAVVRDGHLAPYQELAWLTEPLPSEQQWLDEHELRFRELVTDAARRQRRTGRSTSASGSSPGCATAGREGDEGAEVPWADFQRRHPRARRGRRALPRLRRAAAPAGRAARRGPPPPARPRRLGRPARGLGAALLDGQAVARGGGAAGGGRGRAARPRVPAHAHGDPARRVGRRPAPDRLRRQADRARRGARRGGRGARDRPARARALRRGARRRAPGRRAARRPRPRRRGRRARRCARSPTTRGTAVLRPLLVTGRGLRCAAGDAAALLARAGGGRRRRAGQAPGWSAGPPEDGLVELRGPGDWRPAALGRARHRRLRGGATSARSSAPAPSWARAGTPRASTASST